MRFLMLAGCALLLATTSIRAADDSELQLENRLRAHIEFLADDLMLGRQPGRLAILWELRRLAGARVFRVWSREPGREQLLRQLWLVAEARRLRRGYNPQPATCRRDNHGRFGGAPVRFGLVRRPGGVHRVQRVP